MANDPAIVKVAKAVRALWSDDCGGLVLIVGELALEMHRVET